MDFTKLTDYLTKKGISIPVVRDPVTQKPSVSLTLVVVSAGIVVFGLFNKVAKLVQGVDMDSALSFFYASSALYFGRSFGKIGDKPKEDKNE
jgi:hypothetical protein